ncbi:hypothetical protein [Marinobacter sp. S0848L]|uniref:hypothetical protein n=1 Tax=Marinobacter sp. S0848L TaxID=2926423 RepID=UPI001FF58E22|nr:hypothetical protein [Marinobacter sp. S0848L]MCK0107647.1 hypothetical protein [Marinobacter sp. S0848L]
MLPEHGKINCRACFSDAEGSQRKPHQDWWMINDPGAWGSSTPDYLVLGFSKGATQSGIYNTGRFEDIAFAGMRPRLTQALQKIGLLEEDETSDQKISDPESKIAFGSLIRCSVSRRDAKASKKKGRDVYACTGPLITKSFSEIPDVINACASKYLGVLPKTVRVVVFLGNSDGYVKGCQELLQRQFPDDFEQINDMAVHADGRVWVHIAHPSGLNGHFNTWLNTDSGPGAKRIKAQQALGIV